MNKRIYLPIIDNGMGLVRSSYAFSLLAGFSGRNIEIDRISYPYPDGSCNMATQNFLESGCDEMVIIDGDVVFSRHQIDLLLSHNEPLIFGVYPKKEIGLNFPCMALEGDVENPFSKDGDVCEVARTARGFMRVHRSVFEKMMPHVEYYKDAQTGRMQYCFWKTLQGGHSEDFFFCDLWRSLGGKILIDKRCSVQHEGTAIYPIAGTY